MRTCSATTASVHLDGFVAAYAPDRPRAECVETERFRSFEYDELMARRRERLVKGQRPAIDALAERLAAAS